MKHKLSKTDGNAKTNKQKNLETTIVNPNFPTATAFFLWEILGVTVYHFPRTPNGVRFSTLEASSPTEPCSPNGL